MIFLYKLKDFKYLDTYNCNGKKLGTINDIAINYFDKSIKGFIISCKIFSKKNYVPKEDIVAIGSSIITKAVSTYNGLKFSDIKGMDIINKKGEVIGVVDELLIDDRDFSIKGLIASTGTFHKFVYGNRIFLLNDTILGDNNVLYYGEQEVIFKSMPHKFWKQVNE